PNTALFRVEVIKVPLAHPEQSAIVGRARLCEGRARMQGHGDGPEDIALRLAAVARARAAGGFITKNAQGVENVLNPGQANVLLDSIAKARGAAMAPAPATPVAAGGGGRGGAGGPAQYVHNAADSAALRRALPTMTLAAGGPGGGGGRGGPPTGPNQCHDVTLYPEIGLGGGACQGHGILFDISDPANPRRITDVVDTTNMTGWHSVTFNNDGTKIIFSDEWGGGSSPKCRANDPKEWGADAIFSIENRNQLKFHSYYKLSAVQTQLENCVA